MESKIAKSIGLTCYPVALIWTNDKPHGAMQFKEGKWGCVMWLVAHAAKGKPALCDARTVGCFGGGVGLGFGNQYLSVPGGVECFCHFLSSGNETWETGRQVAEQIKPFAPGEFHDNFLRGERYFKSPVEAAKFVQNLPMTVIPTRYVLFKPLENVDFEKETPEAIIFFADPDQLSALVILANYARSDNENVIIPYAAGCQTLGIYPYHEASSEKPKAVVGMTDITVRSYIRKQLGDYLLTFTAPLRLFSEMEDNVEGSFLQRPAWLDLMQGRKGEKEK
jgi:uncharacterized protein (DUF169 family)